MTKSCTLLVFVFSVLLLSCGDQQARQPKEEIKQSVHVEMNQMSFDELVKQFEDPKRDSWQKVADVISFMDVKNDDVVADIGAGTGYFTFKLAEKAGKVIAIDIDKRMLEFMDEKKIRDSIYNVETRRTKDYDPLLLEKETDVILMVNTFHHIEDRISYLNRVKRGMKEGGRIYVIDFQYRKLNVGPPLKQKLSNKTIYEELSSAGFEVEIDSVLLPYQNIFTARL